MNKKILLSILLIINLITLGLAQNSEKNESPYFMVLTKEGEMAQLPLQSTDVNVKISGVIADVNIKQSYINTSNSTIEAIYVFPASSRSAVYKMVMNIGDRKIIAKIEEKNKANKKYQEAKKKGKTASLLEQKRPNIFKMSVANITPGAKVEVNLSYTELLIPSDKTYEFVYPTVVGPRYVSKQEYQSGQREEWNNNPYLKKGVKPISTLDLHVELNTGIAIQSILCESHNNKIKYSEKNKASISLTDKNGGDRDFIMKYRLAGDKIETGVLLYENAKGENFFLAMLQPPARIEPKHIPAREYVFIMDVSGSMNGFPLDISKELMRNLLGGLKPNDRFNVILFSGRSKVYAKESVVVNKETINDAINFIDNASGYGETKLINALQTAMNMDQTKGFARSFVILTDGYVSVEKDAYDYIRQNLGNANFFTFGIGSSVNRYLIEGMAHVGYGEAFVATTKKDALQMANKFQKYISQPVLTNISYQFNNFKAYDILPKKLPDLFAERPIILTGKYTGNAKGKLKIKGNTGNSSFSQSIKIKNDQNKNNALQYLWAREKIRLLDDYNQLAKNNWNADHVNSLKKEITNLGIKYHLLTQYTSFIAIDSIVSNEGGKQRTVQQAIPLPHGVPNSAISSGNNTQQNNYLSEELEIMDSDDDLEEVEIMVIEEDEEEEEEEPIFVIVEAMPSFPGGYSALKRFLIKNINYPTEAKKKGIQGKVYVSFIIDPDGSISNIRIIRGVHPLLDAEAIRVVKAMPKWKAGSQRGKKVKTSHTMPITFKIENVSKK
jgi:Ca-activated chloride channel family protein